MLEFMACGCPIILGVQNQAQQLVETAQAGICIEPENTEELRDAIIKLYKDKKLRKSLGNNGRSYIAENLSRKRTAATYIEVLKGVVARWRGKRALPQ